MPKSRTSTFARVTVDYMIRGVARVEWLLQPRFIEQGPYQFQLQASRIGGRDWENVGTSQTGIYYALDDTRRLYGQDRRLLYRVEMTTGVATHFSGEAEVIGKLTMRQWLQAREIVRKLALASRGMESFDGWLFRRRVDGQRCTKCLDTLTGGIRNSDCATCKGSGFIDGFFLTSPVTMYDLSPDFRETHNRGNTGTTTPAVVPARFVGLPLIHNRDVWIDKYGDRRYHIHQVRHLSEMNQVPLAVEAELRPAEFTDVIYQIEVPE
jgi:hypothetical protein